MSTARQSAPGLWVVMPVHNEERALGRVVEEWCEALGKITPFVLLAVDDGSSDGSPILLEQMARVHPELRTMRLENRGHGQACLAGYRQAIADGAEWVLQIDSDHQCDPGYFEALWKDRDRNHPGYGARRNREDGWGRGLISFLLRIWVFLFAGDWLKDANCPYRLMHRDTLRETVDEIPRTFYLGNVALSVLQARRFGITWRPMGFRKADRGSQRIRWGHFARQAVPLAGDLFRLEREPMGRTGWLFAALFFAVLPPLFALLRPYLAWSDYFVYAKTAAGVLHGKTLYSQIWEDKPPLGIFFYLIPEWIRSGSPTVAQAFLGGWIALQCFLILWLIPRSAGKARYAAAVLFPLVVLLDPELFWPSTEHASNLFALLNGLFALRLLERSGSRDRDLMMAGVVTALGFQTRQTVLVSGLLPLLAAWELDGFRQAVRSFFRNSVLFLSGMAIASGVVLVAVSHWIDWDTYLYTVFIYPRKYQTGQMDNTLYLWTILSWGFTASVCPILLAELGLGVLAVRGKRLVVLVAMVAVGLLETALPNKPYMHYWASCLVFIPLILALILPRARRLAAAVGLTALLVYVPYHVWPTAHRLDFNAYYHRELELDRLAERLNKSRRPSDSMFVIADDLEGTYLGYRLSAPAANPYFAAFQFDGFWRTILPVPFEEIKAGYLANPPSLLLIHRDFSGEIGQTYLRDLRDSLLAHGYRHVEDSANFQIWRHHAAR